MRISVFIIVFLALPVTCFAQQPRATPTPSPAGRQGGTSVTVDMPATSYRKVGRAEVSYFADSDTSEVRIELAPYSSHGQRVNMFFVYRVKGKVVVSPSEVAVGLVFYADKAKAESAKVFTLDLDGQALSVDNITSNGGGYDYNTKSAFMDFNGTVRFAPFQTLVNSKSVKVHVADVTFELGKKERDALRDLIRAIKQPKAGS